MIGLKKPFYHRAKVKYTCKLYLMVTSKKY